MMLFEQMCAVFEVHKILIDNNEGMKVWYVYVLSACVRVSVRTALASKWISIKKRKSNEKLSSTNN